MLIWDVTPNIENTIEFDYSKTQRVPSVYGCYIISNFNNEIMYMGKASSLNNRLMNHLGSADKNAVTKLGKPYWFSYKVCENDIEISSLERGWLNQYELITGALPIFNKIRA